MPTPRPRKVGSGHLVSTRWVSPTVFCSSGRNARSEDGYSVEFPLAVIKANGRYERVLRQLPVHFTGRVRIRGTFANSYELAQLVFNSGILN